MTSVFGLMHFFEELFQQYSLFLCVVFSWLWKLEHVKFVLCSMLHSVGTY